MKPRLLISLALLALQAPLAVAATKPNIVLLYIDDWAWNGSPVAMDDAMQPPFPRPPVRLGQA